MARPEPRRRAWPRRQAMQPPAVPRRDSTVASNVRLPRPSPGLRACHPLSAYRRPSPGLRACHPLSAYHALRRGSERATLYRPTTPFAGAQSVPPFIGLPRPSPGSERATLYRPTAPFAGAQSVPPFIGLPRPSPGLRACHPLSAYHALRRGSERATLYRPTTPFAGAQGVPPLIGLPRPSPGLRACHRAPRSAKHWSAKRRCFSAHGVCSLHYCIPPNGAPARWGRLRSSWRGGSQGENRPSP